VTAKELKDKLDNILTDGFNDGDELTVSIPCDGPTVRIGPRGSVPVKSVSRGIDWDNGRLFINPDEDLSVKQLDVLKKARALDRVRELVRYYEANPTAKEFKDKYTDFHHSVVQALKRVYGDNLGFE
jgi:hypothetical protein